MFKNKYEADNSRFGEVLTQVLSAHGIGVRHFLAEAKVGKSRFCQGRILSLRVFACKSPNKITTNHRIKSPQITEKS